MKSWIIFIGFAFTLGLPSCGNRDMGIMAREVRSEYRAVRRHTDSIFLSDSIDVSGTRLPNASYLRDAALSNDTDLLHTILDSGKLMIESPQVLQRMLLPSRVRVMDLAGFDSVAMHPPDYTREELQARHTVDSLTSYLTGHVGDSAGIGPYRAGLDSALQSPVYRSSELRRLRSEKDLMIFRPFRKYKNYVLLDMVNYHFDGRDMEVFRLINLDDER